ncbi:MAG: C39 family peptidase [Mycobacterium sp.]|uniref:C39 family peptidase n=1 Tax=Mycobacterium sp. TaxID=1785 RepID=UPI001EC7A939|nr:C39 family peptidase [Mycobacterium sp.]MBW0017570.1 C39 family peptidase [Mycobacterium sp.]
MINNKIVAAARKAGQTGLLAAAAAAALVGFAGAAHAAPQSPAPNATQGSTLYGNPTEAAQWWRHQHLEDCGPMSAADVVGQMTGSEPSETAIWAASATMRSTVHSGPISIGMGISPEDLPKLLAHYNVKATLTDSKTQSQTGLATGLTALEQYLAQGHAVIAGVNAETIWNMSGDTTDPDHAVVVTGIDTQAGVVHLNDSGIDTGRDEQVPLATFEKAWATSNNMLVVTADTVKVK